VIDDKTMSGKPSYLAASTGLVVSTTNQGSVGRFSDDRMMVLEEDLCGYAESLRATTGDEVPVYVHSLGRGAAQLFRHGAEKLRIGEPVKFEKWEQKLPDGDFTETGPLWQKSLTVCVPDDAQPGLYSVELNNDRSEKFSIPLVVESRRRRERVLVLASTNTWCAYNIWGGRSRYRDHLARPVSHGFRQNLRQAIRISLRRRPWLLAISRKIGTTRTVPGREIDPEVADGANYSGAPLSLSRPFPGSGLDDGSAHNRYCNHLAAGEWRALAWLEENEIAYDYASDLEVEKCPERFAEYDAVIISTHSEYWSKAAFEGLLAANLAGTAVISLSGNTIFRECRADEDRDRIQFVGDKFHESAADEGQLMGVRYTNVDVSTAASYRVRPAMSEHFAELKFAEGDVIGAETLFAGGSRFFGTYQPHLPSSPFGLQGSGASGWETDKLCTDDDKFHVIAKGQNPNGGADMVFRAEEGARGLVFSASSMTFTASLLVDKGCSAIVSAVIERALRETQEREVL